MDKIKIKRGNQAQFGNVVLSAGEPAFVLDEKALYIGDGTNKIMVGKENPLSKGDKMSSLVNDKKFTCEGCNISKFTNDEKFIKEGSGLSKFKDDVGFMKTTDILEVDGGTF